jgi:nucleotide-binding universal stress UspA family protein
MTMFKRVLIPTDFSSYAHKMQECVAEIEGIEEIVLLNVLEANNPMNLEKKGWSYESMIDEAQTRLAEQADHLAHQLETERAIKTRLMVIVEPMSGADGVNLNRIKPAQGMELIDGGSIGDAIIKAAAEVNASLICMGAQGKGLVEGMLLGSVSTEVLRKGETDLLIIRHKIMDEKRASGGNNPCKEIFSKVMLTTDFSEAGQEAISAAKEMPGVKEILLVNVIARDDEFTDAGKKINDINAEMENLKEKVTMHVLKGKASEEILTLAKKQGVSLIAMGSQGKSWSKQIRVGSTTFDVARRAECPVLVIRPKKS